MKKSAFIHLKDFVSDVRFEWSGFDGDDGFNYFHVLVYSENQLQKYDFGACAIFGLRKLSNFFSDISQETAGLGFRNPDTRYCDVFRSGNDFRLVIQYEGDNVHKEFDLIRPMIQINDAFLRSYGQ